MEETAKKLMSSCSSESVQYENFPKGLVDLRTTLLGAAVDVTKQAVGTGLQIAGGIGNTLFGAMGQKPGGSSAPSGSKAPQPFVDFSWESQDYIVNILYDRFVSLPIHS
jgi:hypothetical protein